MLNNFGEKRKSGISLKVVKALLAFSNITFPEIAIAQISPVRHSEIVLKKVDVEALENEIIINKDNPKKQYRILAEAMRQMPDSSKRSAFFNKIHPHLNILLKVTFPTYFSFYKPKFNESDSAQNNFEINIDLGLASLATKVFPILPELVQPGGFGQVEREWAAVMIARNILLESPATTDVSQTEVIAMFKKILELRRKFETTEIFGPQTLLVSSILKDKDGIANFTPQKTVDEISKLNTVVTDLRPFDSNMTKFREKMDKNIVDLVSGSTILFNAHGIHTKSRGFVFNFIDENFDLKNIYGISELIESFAKRYATHPDTIRSDSQNPLKIISSACDGKFVTEFLKKWSEKFGSVFPPPIILGETEENAVSLIIDKNPNKSVFLSELILQTQKRGKKPPTIGRFLDEMYGHYLNHNKKGTDEIERDFTKPIIFVPLRSGKYLQIAQNIFNRV